MKRTIFFVVIVCLCYVPFLNGYAQTRKRQSRPQPKNSQPQQKGSPSQQNADAKNRPSINDPISGEWEGTAEYRCNPYPFTFKLKLDGEKVTLLDISIEHESIKPGSWADGKLTLAYLYSQGATTVTMTATLQEGKLVGEITHDIKTQYQDQKGAIEGVWEARRKNVSLSSSVSKLSSQEIRSVQPKKPMAAWQTSFAKFVDELELTTSSDELKAKFARQEVIWEGIFKGISSDPYKGDIINIDLGRTSKTVIYDLFPLRSTIDEWKQVTPNTKVRFQGKISGVSANAMSLSIRGQNYNTSIVSICGVKFLEEVKP